MSGAVEFTELKIVLIVRSVRIARDSVIDTRDRTGKLKNWMAKLSASFAICSRGEKPVCWTKSQHQSVGASPGETGCQEIGNIERALKILLIFCRGEVGMPQRLGARFSITVESSKDTETETERYENEKKKKRYIQRKIENEITASESDRLPSPVTVWPW